MSDDLREDRDHLLRSLEDLDREHAAGDLAEGDYLALKEDYTARAAEVLRALEATAGARPAPSIAAAEQTPGDLPRTPAAAGRSRWRPALAGAVLLAFAGGAGAVVAHSAGERTPGAAATGSITPTGSSAGVADDLADARRLIGKGETLAAIKVYDAILERDPEQPEALAYRGWLLRLAGRAAGKPELVDKGMEFIERAVAADPTYPDAHFFRAFVLYQDRHDPAAAVPELRAFLAGNPPEGMVAVVQDLLSRALAESQGSPAPAPTVAPPPNGTAPPG